jgi:hypothetical protein
MTAAPITPAPVATPTITAAAVAGAHLGRLRWAVRATLTLGVAASVAANILHARPSLISQLIAAWPPLALLLTVELISRVPTHRRSLGIVRLVATAAIAGIAAWVSYWHMVGVAARYGETEAAAAYLLPLSVDGLVIVASISLVELTGRIRASTPERRGTSLNPVERVPASATAPAAPPPQQPPTPTSRAGGAAQSIAAATTRPVPGTTPGGEPGTACPSVPPPVNSLPTVDNPPDKRRQACGTDAELAVTANRGSATSNRGGDRDPSRPFQDDRPDGSTPSDDRVPTKTADAVAYWYHRDPDLHPAEIAARINRSERTVRRHWPPTRHNTASSANGHPASRLVDSRRH